jgi:hypothetical protein
MPIGWTAARLRIVVGVTAVALAVLIGWLLWTNLIDTGSSGYATPAKAVIAACHPTEILSTQQSTDSEKITVAWRDGIIWAALVAEHDGKYTVVKCRYGHVPHA